MDIGIIVQEQLLHLLDHAQRFLRRSTTIEVGQSLTIDRALQDWKLLAYLLYIKHRYSFSFACTAWLSISRNASTSHFVTTSSTKPSNKRRSADSCEIPRWRI